VAALECEKELNIKISTVSLIGLARNLSRNYFPGTNGDGIFKVKDSLLPVSVSGKRRR
jgi:hypothetical protein